MLLMLLLLHGTATDTLALVVAATVVSFLLQKDDVAALVFAVFVGAAVFVACCYCSLSLLWFLQGSLNLCCLKHNFTFCTLKSDSNALFLLVLPESQESRHRGREAFFRFEHGRPRTDAPSRVEKARTLLR